MNIFLSIVIPVFNAQNTILRCLDSIWSQSIDEKLYEVICVNDCSTDSSVNVIYSLIEKHHNLRIIYNEKNVKAGGARNNGVKASCGEYILFIDADDYFEANSLKIIFDYQKEMNLDILVCDFSRHVLNNPNMILVHNFKNKEIMNGRDFFLKNGIPYAPWKFMFKKKIMIDNDIYFQENVCCEDVDWAHRLVLCSKTIQYMPILLLHYILNSNSQTACEVCSFNSISQRLFAGYRMYNLSFDYDKIVAKKLQNISSQYFIQGLKYMTALYMPKLKKKEVIIHFIPTNPNFPILVNLVRKYPNLFVFISNLISPFIKQIINIKRMYAKR